MNFFHKSFAPFKMHSVTQKPFRISKNNLCFEKSALLDGITYHIYVNKRLFLIYYLKSESMGKGKHVLWLSYTFYTSESITDMLITHLQ